MPLLVVMLSLSVGAARPWLEEAKASMANLEFTEALARLEVARQAPSLEPAVLREVDELRAYCLVALGKWSEAEALWVQLLRADPMTTPAKSLASPKVLRVFDQAKRQLFPKSFVALEQVEPAASPVGGAGDRVRVRLVDPWAAVTSVVLLTRGANEAFRPTELTREEGFATGSFPAGTVAWYLEARGATGVMARIGSPEAPKVRDEPTLVPARVPERGPQVTLPTTPSGAPGVRTVVGIGVLGLGVIGAGIASWLAVSGHQLRLAARDPSKPPGDFASTALAADRDGVSRQGWAVGLFIGAGLAVAGGVLTLVW